MRLSKAILNLTSKSKNDINRVEKHLRTATPDKLPRVQVRSCDSIGCPVLGSHSGTCHFHTRRAKNGA